MRNPLISASETSHTDVFTFPSCSSREEKLLFYKQLKSKDCSWTGHRGKTLLVESVAFICPCDLIVWVSRLQFFRGDGVIGSSKALKQENQDTEYSLNYIIKCCTLLKPAIGFFRIAHHGIAVDVDLFVSTVVSDPATSYTLTVHAACSLQLTRNLVIDISCTGHTHTQEKQHQSFS